ncbi:MAG TPA: LysR family transcriptional regulator [Acidimicrobiales bacterium]
MDLRQLQAVLAVADHGTFSAAADALHTVQSNVSTHVARLERELGVTLIDRAAGGLTEEGELVVQRGRRVMAELEALVVDVAALRHEVQGTARLGMIGTIARWLAPQLLDVMATRHPNVHLVIVEGTSNLLEPQLSSGRLDMAVLNLPVPSEDLVTALLFDEDLVLVVPTDDPLARRGRLVLADVATLDLLLPPAGTAFRDELDEATRPAGVVLRAKTELDGTWLIASLTFEGHGPAILPASAVPGYMRDRWALVNVEGFPRRHVGVAQRRKGLLSAPARATLEVLNELVQGGGTDLPPGIHLRP